MARSRAEISASLVIVQDTEAGLIEFHSWDFLFVLSSSIERIQLSLAKRRSSSTRVCVLRCSVRASDILVVSDSPTSSDIVRTKAVSFSCGCLTQARSSSVCP